MMALMLLFTTQSALAGKPEIKLSFTDISGHNIEFISHPEQPIEEPLPVANVLIKKTPTQQVVTPALLMQFTRQEKLAYEPEVDQLLLQYSLHRANVPMK